MSELQPANTQPPNLATSDFMYAVVIPAHNAAAFVAAAVHSAFLQTWPPAEVIVVDDGSADDTAAAALSAGARVIRHDASLGPSASRNRGIRDSTAPFLAFLDADDEWLPGHAEHLGRLMQRTGAEFTSSSAEMFGGVTGSVRAAVPPSMALDIRDALMLDNPIVQSSAIASRRILFAAGLYDDELRMSEDFDLWTRVAEHGTFAYSDTITVRRRMHSGQLTHGTGRTMIKAAWAVRRKAILRRLAHASVAERKHTLTVMESAARQEILRTIWGGELSSLTLLRDELRATDRLLGTDRRLAKLAGDGATALRIRQDLEVALRHICHRLLGRRGA